MKPYQLVIFDWEGTLNNGLGQVLQAFIDATKALGLPKVNQSLLRDNLGLEAYRMISLLYPQLHLSTTEALLAEYQKNLMCSKRGPLLFQGVRKLLENLKANGTLVAILTCKGRSALDMDLEVLGLSDVFFSTKTPNECAPKPNPEGIITLINEALVDEGETIMVGDSPSDMMAAQAANVKALGVDFMMNGSAKRLQEAGASDVVDSVEALSTYFGYSSPAA